MSSNTRAVLFRRPDTVLQTEAPHLSLMTRERIAGPLVLGGSFLGQRDSSVASLKLPFRPRQAVDNDDSSSGHLNIDGGAKVRAVGAPELVSSQTGTKRS
jgi:hypothetical protein